MAKKPDTPQDVARQLANVIEALDTALDNVPLVFPTGEDFGDHKAWSGIWTALDAANDAGMVLLGREGVLLNTEVCDEAAVLVGRVVSYSRDADGEIRVSLDDNRGGTTYVLPPSYGPRHHFPAEWYFRRPGSNAYDWSATAELLRDFGAEPVKVAA